MNDDITRILLTVIFASLAGGLTNTVAVWMLFHPYEPPRLLRWRIGLLQGAIPKNKARLARAIGRTVGTRLLTSEDLARTLAEPAFRQAFDERLAALLDNVLEERRGSLAELLPPPLLAEVQALLGEAQAAALARLHDYLAGDAFEAAARAWVMALADELRDRPLGELLTPAREMALAEAADSWIARVVEGDGFTRTVRASLDRAAERLLVPGRTFQELLPVGLVAAIERAIAGYLPLTLERLGGLLEAPGARARVERILHELLDRFMRDLRFHQRLVAALLITPETIDRVIRAIEAEGAAKMAELLHDADVREAMARGVNDAIVDFLRKEVVAVLGRPDDEAVADVKATLTGWALQLARDPQTRSFLVEQLRTVLGAAERRTWGDIFERVPPDRFADGLIAAARGARARSVYADVAQRLADTVLHRPLGRPADHLPADAGRRIERALAEPVWNALQDQVPFIVQRLDVAARVEQKIMEFPTAQVEAIIRGVTERELRLIVKLGYLLGALIGLSSGVLTLFL